MVIGEVAGDLGAADDAALHSSERDQVMQKGPLSKGKARAGKGVGHVVARGGKVKHSQKEFDEKLSKR